MFMLKNYENDQKGSNFCTKKILRETLRDEFDRFLKSITSKTFHIRFSVKNEANVTWMYDLRTSDFFFRISKKEKDNFLSINLK